VVFATKPRDATMPLRSPAWSAGKTGLSSSRWALTKRPLRSPAWSAGKTTTSGCSRAPNSRRYGARPGRPGRRARSARHPAVRAHAATEPGLVGREDQNHARA